MSRYLRLFRPPTLRLVDSLAYVLLCLLTATVAPPMALLTRRTLRQSVSIAFTSLMPRDLLVDWMGVLFNARKGKADLLLLNPLSSPATWRYFTPEEGDVVIDVGAHIGKYALVAAKRVGVSGKVIAVEAHPDNYQALLNNIRLNGLENVVAVNAAAHSEDGSTLRLFGQWDTAYTLKRWHPTCVKVPSRSIDSIAREHGIGSADWVKVDVEGAEVEALSGMAELIDSSPNLSVVVEVSPSNERDIDRMLSGFEKKALGRVDVLYRKRRQPQRR